MTDCCADFYIIDVPGPIEPNEDDPEDMTTYIAVGVCCGVLLAVGGAVVVVVVLVVKSRDLCVKGMLFTSE